MTHFYFREMTKDNAAAIGSWRYDEPYSLYSMDGSEEELTELMSGEYYAGMNSELELVGFICTGFAARVPGGYTAGIYEDPSIIDIGLGLQPQYTNKGIGYDYLTSGLSFLMDRHQLTVFQLVVAAFNERAIKVYERAGFVKCNSFKSRSYDRELVFINMKYFVSI